MGPTGRRAGFTLIELAIVLVISGILVAITAPLQRRAVRDARAIVVRSHLRNALTAELTWYAEHNAFTNDHSKLLDIDPSLPFDGSTGSIFIVTSASPGTPAVCLFAESSPGDWHTLYYSATTDEASDLATPADCTRRMLDERLMRTFRAPPASQ
jgi:prepilin-type N-terminal cleavage/methylation domain-containing protein